jgi:hypothetical protein
MTKILTLRANAFGIIETIKVQVTVETLPVTQDRVCGLIRVWDSCAGYFTTCHSLSDSAKTRIRKLAMA